MDTRFEGCQSLWTEGLRVVSHCGHKVCGWSVTVDTRFEGSQSLWTLGLRVVSLCGHKV